MNLPALPAPPEFRDDRWYYQGFSQYLKTEAFEVYHADCARVWKERCELAMSALEKLHQRVVMAVPMQTPLDAPLDNLNEALAHAEETLAALQAHVSKLTR